MKDPAFLFYYQDWLVGTYFLNRREKGAYMDLLCYQADKGFLTLTAVKEILNGDFECWEKLKEKFTEQDGCFYNKRLKNEQDKRAKHSSYQSEKAKKRWNKDECPGNAPAMPLEDENKNEDESLIEQYWEKWKKYKKDEFRFSYKSEVSEQAAKNELINLSGNNAEIAIRIIEQSIAKGWKGFFKLNGNGTNKLAPADGEELTHLVAYKLGKQ